MTFTRNSHFFVGIGAAKAGTTWLAGYLRAHPQVFVSPLKELHYFDEKHLPEYAGNVSERFLLQAKRFASGLTSAEDTGRLLRLQHLIKRLEMRSRPRAYVEYFQQFAHRKHRAFGEITPSYSMLGDAGFKDILKHFPRARIVFILRNPVDRYWSQLRFAQRLDEQFDPSGEFERRVHDPQFALRTQYEKTFAALDRVVPRDQVFTTFYESLFGEKGDQELERLCNFLEVDVLPGDFATIPNKGLPYDLPDAGRAEVIRFFLPTYQFVSQRFGDEMPARWRADLDAGT